MRKTHYRTTPDLVATQRQFWISYHPEMEGYTYKEALLPIGRVASPGETLTDAELDPYRKAMRRGDPFPPVLVEGRRRGRWLVSDGNHRYRAANLEGYTHIPVLIATPALPRMLRPRRPLDQALPRRPKRYRRSS